MLYCVSLLEKPIKKRGTPRKMCIWLHWQTVFTFYAFFIWWEETLLDSELWLYYKSMSSAVDFLFSLENDRACVSVCMHSFAWKRATNTHIWWIRMGRSSELCRALTESSFEMYIQCEGLKWFLLNSIFYRFCRHFVVGRKKIKEILWVHSCLVFLSQTYTFLFLQQWNNFILLH